MKIESLMPTSIGGLDKAQKTSASDHFGEVLQNAITETADAQKKAEALSMAAAQGENVPMQDVIEAVSKAELTLQTMLTVRDKAVSAYKEIINMPI